ncbi:hypothetical protein DQ241_15060 [Blastococcus sp. TF02A-30]|nr:hypothetical protein DQ241_15060 [Blastococcus sp. TF02A-30]
MTSAGPPPAGRDPWSDPATPTRPGPPWSGPPAPPAGPAWGPPPHGTPTYAPPTYAPPPYGGWPPGPYGAPGWGPPPRPPRTPASVVTAAVLAFVQAVVVLIASLYVWFFASIADIASSGRPGVYTSETARSLATEGTVLAVLQLVSVVALVVGGLLALNRRTPAAYRTLAGALVAQVVIALYWAARLLDVVGDVPGSDGKGVLAAFTLFFLAGPAVALGLLLTNAARGWFTGTPPA